MQAFKNRLTNTSMMKFIVVTVPTSLAVNESKLLIHELEAQHVCVEDVVVNQCLTLSNHANYNYNYYRRCKRGQEKCIGELQSVVDNVVE